MQDIKKHIPLLKLGISLSLLVIIALQLTIIYLVFRPINILGQLDSVKIINEATKEAQAPVNELPQVGVIGDKKVLASLDEIKKGNAIDAEIYKDAKDGDYVLGYTSKIIIYRPSEKRVVYNGDTPQQKLAKSQEALVNLVIKSAQNAKLIPADYKLQPQISVVNDAENLKKQSDIYADVMKDDLVGIFSNPNLIVIYRPSTASIVKSGNLQLSVN